MSRTHPDSFLLFKFSSDKQSLLVFYGFDYGINRQESNTRVFLIAI